MHFAPELVHFSTGRFRIPIINSREQSKERSRRYDVMEMRDDVVSVVEVEIGGVKRQRDAGKTADSKHRQERGGKKHRHIKSDRAAPERNEERAQDDDRRNRDQQRGGLEKRAHSRTHAGEPHVMRPDDERQKADHEHRENERLVTPKRFARIVGENFADDPEGGQDQNANFGVTKKPKQMLTQKGTVSAADGQGSTVYDHSGREEETRGRSSIHQLHDDRGLERRKGEQQQKRSDKLCPYIKWQPH